MLINPEITFKLPCFTLATIFPSFVAGSNIKVSITTSDSSPTVKVDWSNNKIWVPEAAPEIIDSFKYILSPIFNSLVSVLTVPEITPTIPTSCLSIFNVSLANELILIKNNKLMNIVRILFILGS